jgi:hypothetical protein
MVQGKVIHVNVDASEAPSPNIHEVGRERLTGPSPFALEYLLSPNTKRRSTKPRASRDRFMMAAPT